MPALREYLATPQVGGVLPGAYHSASAHQAELDSGEVEPANEELGAMRRARAAEYLRSLFGDPAPEEDEEELFGEFPEEDS